MFPENWYMFFVAALIPMVVGSIWYGPLFGKKWMNINNFTEEYLKEGNMAVIMGVSYFLSLMLALALSGSVIHQSQIPGLFANFDPTGPEVADMQAFMTKYGDVHRTFTHGVVHGIINSIFLALPLIAINALFERRGATYIFVHFGYWLITIALMGGLLCATLKWAPMM